MELGNAIYTPEELEFYRWGDRNKMYRECQMGIGAAWSGLNFDDEGRLHDINLMNGSGDGQLSESLGELWRVGKFYLVNFKNLNGVIPYSLGEIPEIKWFAISETSITGTIPDSFLKKATGIVSINLNDNKLSGPIPEWVYSFSRLYYLHLGGNNFDNQPGYGNLCTTPRVD